MKKKYINDLVQFWFYHSIKLLIIKVINYYKNVILLVNIIYGMDKKKSLEGVRGAREVQ